MPDGADLSLHNFPPYMVVLFLVWAEWLPLMVLWAFAGYINGVSLLIIHAVGSLNHPAVIIRSGQLHIVIADNCFALFCSDDGSNDVALGVFSFCGGVVRAEFAIYMVVDAETISGGGCDVVKIIAAADIHPTDDRAELMSWIQVAIIFQYVFGRPAVFPVSADEKVVDAIV